MSQSSTLPLSTRKEPESQQKQKVQSKTSTLPLTMPPVRKSSKENQNPTPSASSASSSAPTSPNISPRNEKCSKEAPPVLGKGSKPATRSFSRRKLQSRRNFRIKNSSMLSQFSQSSPNFSKLLKPATFQPLPVLQTSYFDFSAKVQPKLKRKKIVRQLPIDSMDLPNIIVLEKSPIKTDIKSLQLENEMLQSLLEEADSSSAKSSALIDSLEDTAAQQLDKIANLKAKVTARELAYKSLFSKHRKLERSIKKSPPAMDLNAPPSFFPMPVGAFKKIRWTSVADCAAHREQRSRQYMQDSFACFDSFAGENSSGFFSIFDGHGGPFAASYATCVFPSTFQGIMSAKDLAFNSNLSNSKGTVVSCLVETFLLIDSTMKTLHLDEDGSTGTVVFRRDGKLICANVGDTEAILISCNSESNSTSNSDSFEDSPQLSDDDNTSWTCKLLTTAHTARSPSEKKRILAAGDKIRNKRGDVRIFVPHIGFGLEISRSIGDHLFRSFAKSVICDPSVSEHDLTPEDKYVVIATDGLWGVLKPKDVLNIVQTNSSKTCSVIVAAIFSEARKAIDNTTVVVLKL